MELDENFFKSSNNNYTNRTAESFLMEDEKILWRGKAKKLAYIAGQSLQIAPIAIIWLMLDLFFISILFRSGAWRFLIVIIIPFFLIHLTPFWVFLHSVLKASREQRTIEYVITNKRVIEFRGEQKYIYKLVYLDKMTDVSLKINLVDKILGVGDITIHSDSNIIITEMYNGNFTHLDKKHNKQINMEDFNKSLIIYDVKDSINLHSKLLQICHRNHNIPFESPNVVCKNCGTMYEKTKTRCPSCGSPNSK